MGVTRKRHDRVGSIQSRILEDPDAILPGDLPSVFDMVSEIPGHFGQRRREHWVIQALDEGESFDDLGGGRRGVGREVHHQSHVRRQWTLKSCEQGQRRPFLHRGIARNDRHGGLARRNMSARTRAEGSVPGSVEDEEQGEQQEKCHPMCKACSANPRARDRLNPGLFPAFQYRLLDDPFLKKMEGAGGWIGSLLDRGDEQRMKLGIMPFDLTRDRSVVGLPSRAA